MRERELRGGAKRSVVLSGTGCRTGSTPREWNASTLLAELVPQSVWIRKRTGKAAKRVQA